MLNMDSLHEDIISAIIATTGKNEDIQPFAILVGGETASGKLHADQSFFRKKVGAMINDVLIELHYMHLLLINSCAGIKDC